MSKRSRVPSRDPRRHVAAALVLAMGLFASCAKPHSEGPPLVTWKADIGPLFQAQCVECHGGATPAGDYSLETYLGALGNGTNDQPNAIEGDAQSVLLTKLQQPEHAAYLGSESTQRDERFEEVRRWVVDDALAYFYSGFHTPEILNTENAGFHGNLVAEQGWTMDSCRQCHGQDYAGGFFGVSCLTCHPNRPDACDTCHGQGPLGAPPPAVFPGHDAGAHQPHLVDGTQFKPVACGDCHVVPERLSSPGHLTFAAEMQSQVVFSELARAKCASPTYDAATKTCSNTYCHGTIDGATKPAPQWDEPDDVASDCTSCHGFPPTTLTSGGEHPQVDASCSLCHPDVGPDDTITQPDLHVNGTADIITTGACNTCHSSPDDPLPFEYFGTQETPEIGAHDPHVGPNPFHAEQDGTRGYACSVCHPVPELVNSPGHLNGVVNFAFSGAAVGTSPLQPSYDPATGTCSSVWCHGAAFGSQYATTPAWGGGAGVQCGDCHGLPPATEPHNVNNHTNCYLCHGAVIGPDLQFVDISKHVDGKLEFNQ